MDANNQFPSKPKVLEVIDKQDEREARVAFARAMRTKPKSTIETVKGADGALIYRVTVIESSWGD